MCQCTCNCKKKKKRKGMKLITALILFILLLLLALDYVDNMKKITNYQSRLILQQHELIQEHDKEITHLKLAVYELSKDTPKPAPKPKKKEEEKENISAYEVATNPVSFSITVLGGLEVIRRMVTRGL
jgi:predicted Holliday junction resolvase-like endonuclease